MIAKKRILCVADSLSLPRVGVSYEDTWICKLKKKVQDSDIITKLQRGLTSSDIAKNADYLEFYNPDIVVVQVGIVDCAPRYIRSDSSFLKVINKMPKILQNNFWKLFKKFRERESNFADVSLPDFIKNLSNYALRCEKLNVEKLIFIKIAHPGQNMIEKNQKIIHQILNYNLQIDKVCEKFQIAESVNPISTLDNSLFIDDGYHLNGNGGSKVCDSLLTVLQSQKS